MGTGFGNDENEFTMKVAFLNPPWWSEAVHKDQGTGCISGLLRGGIRAGSRWPFTRNSPYPADGFRHGSYIPYPFFLGAAAGWVKRAMPDATVYVRDSIARGESYGKFFDWLENDKPDYAVIETGAAAADHDLKLISIMRKAVPGIKVAIAWPVAATLFKDGGGTQADAYLQGEYEHPAVKFVGGERGLLQYQLLTKEELHEVPFPLFDEEVALHYWDACPKGQEHPQLQLFSSRGCPFKCCFCAWPAAMTGHDPDGKSPRSVRFYSPKWIEYFILHRVEKALRAGTPLKTIYFDDDTFNLVDKHVLEVCEVMQRIKLPWFAMCRADTSKKETWLAMKAAGCKGVKLGFESGSQRVIDEIVNKRLDLKEAGETAIWLREQGFTVHGTFTVGLPGETAEEQKRTVEFIGELYERGALDTHQLSGTAEISGTPLHTLRVGNQALEKFPGAKITDDYHANPDGELKRELMTR